MAWLKITQMGLGTVLCKASPGSSPRWENRCPPEGQNWYTCTHLMYSSLVPYSAYGPSGQLCQSFNPSYSPGWTTACGSKSGCLSVPCSPAAWATPSSSPWCVHTCTPRHCFVWLFGFLGSYFHSIQDEKCRAPNSEPGFLDTFLS